MIEALGEFYSEAAWQRCAVHFDRNVFTVTLKTKGAFRVCAVLR